MAYETEAEIEAEALRETLRLWLCRCWRHPDDPDDWQVTLVPGTHDFSCEYREAMQPVLRILAGGGYRRARGALRPSTAGATDSGAEPEGGVQEGGACDPWEGLTDEEREEEIAKLKGEGMSDQTYTHDTLRAVADDSIFSEVAHELLVKHAAAWEKQLEAVKAREEAYADLLTIATGVRAGWLSDLTVPELVQKWEAMSELIDFVDHGTTPASWLAYKKHRARAASEPPGEEGT